MLRHSKKQKAPSIPFEKFEDKVTVTLQIFMLFILKLFLKLHMREYGYYSYLPKNKESSLIA